MDSHSGRGVVTFDTGEAMDVSYSLDVRVSGGFITVTGNVEESGPRLPHRWFGKTAVITLHDGTRLPIVFDRPPARFTATSGPL